MKRILNIEPEHLSRIIILFLILSIAFANPLIHSIRTVIQPEIRELYDNLHSNFDVFSVIVSEITALGTLFYTLAIRQQSISSIGIQTNLKKYWLDHILMAVVLTIIVKAVSFFSYIVFNAIYYSITTQNYVFESFIDSFAKGYLILWLIFMIINPFFEELIVRGYLMSELDYLTNNKTFSILASIIFQTSYHLYQGWASALYLSITFTVYSLYFAKYKNIYPVILSHLYFDLAALYYYKFQI